MWLGHWRLPFICLCLVTRKLAQIVDECKDEIERHGMNISAIDLSFDDSMMWLDLSDGRKLSVPLASFPRLLRATPEQHLQYEMSGNGLACTGKHLMKTSA